nr:immunoglobulin light chain junction region [Macaca mulatta]
CRQGYRPPYSF